eukprot:Skav229407  [mRNA]  locus=scaffold2297:58571:61990:+ [translate_table: standard]
MAFCRRQRLPPSKAEALAERLEFLTRRLPAKGSENVKAKAKAKAGAVPWGAGTVRRRPPVDPQDAEALRRRVKALQKKLREIEKLKAHGCATVAGRRPPPVTPENALDVLQREKISGEPQGAKAGWATGGSRGPLEQEVKGGGQTMRLEVKDEG